MKSDDVKQYILAPGLKFPAKVASDRESYIEVYLDSTVVVWTMPDASCIVVVSEMDEAVVDEHSHRCCAVWST